MVQARRALDLHLQGDLAYFQDLKDWRDLVAFAAGPCWKAQQRTQHLTGLFMGAIGTFPRG